MTKGRCKHCRHEGLKIKCALGLDPEALAKAACPPDQDYRNGLFFRIPCDSVEWQMGHWHGMNPKAVEALRSKAKCDKFEDPTDEEISAFNGEMDAAFKRMDLVVPLIARIKKEHSESWSGVEKCAACGGRLHLKLNCFDGIEGPQKHCHGRCETEGCVSWME